MYQGSDELEQRNWAAFPYTAARLTAVVVTHAHLDHTGLLPRLVAEGYSGPIYCRGRGGGRIALVRRDPPQRQGEGPRSARQKGYGSRHAEPKPLYTEEDARR